MTGDAMNRTKHASVVDQIWPGAQLKSSRRLPGGVSAEVYVLEVMHPSGDVIHTVLREHSRSHAGFSAELEYNLLTALHLLGLPVPEALMFDESCDLVATPYLIMEFVGGSNVKWSGLFRQVEGEAKIVSDWFLPSLKPYRPAYLDPCQPLRGSLLGANRNVRF